MNVPRLLAILLFTTSFTHAGEIVDLHKKLVAEEKVNYERSRDHDEVDSDKHGITELGLERTR